MTLVEFIQAADTPNLVTIKNAGLNTMNYKIQEFNGTAWVTMGASGSDYYDTLVVDEVKPVVINSSNPRTRIVGNASGGAVLEFTSSRIFPRASGGAAPLLNL